MLDGILLVALTFKSNLYLATQTISLDCNAVQLRNGQNDEDVDKFRTYLRDSITQGRKGIDNIGIIGADLFWIGVLSSISTGVIYLKKNEKLNHNKATSGNPAPRRMPERVVRNTPACQ
jgi:hypothetical protein